MRERKKKERLDYTFNVIEMIALHSPVICIQYQIRFPQ